MGNWAQKTAQKLRQKDDSEKRQQEIAIERRTQSRIEAPNLWEALKEALAIEVTSLNRLRPGQISLRLPVRELTAINLKSHQIELNVAFDANVPAINFMKSQIRDPYSDSEESRGRFTFEASNDLTSVWLRRSDGDTVSVPQAADYLLDMLF